MKHDLDNETCFPKWLVTVPGYLSKSILNVSPFYDTLRDLPHFHKILNTEYQTKL